MFLSGKGVAALHPSGFLQFPWKSGINKVERGTPLAMHQCLRHSDVLVLAHVIRT